MHWCFIATIVVISVVPSACSKEHAQGERGTDSTTRAASAVADAEQRRAANRAYVEALGKGDDAYDRRFMELMIAHHQGEIVLAKAVVAHTTHDELRSMAESIAADDETQINQMDAWRAVWYTTDTTRLVESDAQRLRDASVPPPDVDEENELMSSLSASVDRAEAIAFDGSTRATHPDVTQIAGRIRDSSSSRIRRLKQWQSSWYGE
jgi:uncharacterized protein (DUF305 family)